MNQETNDFLEENLNEAHTTFNSIIKEMHDGRIPFNYEFIEEREKESFKIVCDIIDKMNFNVYEYNDLKEKNNDLFNVEYKIYLKYFMLYLISITFIKGFHKIFDTSKLSEILKYAIGMFLGSTYIALMNKDIYENRNGSKDRRDLINRLKTLKEEYKVNHDKAVNEIDYMFALNTNLWNELDKNKKKSKTSK